jgi:2-dehydropantoate 2-reductase
MQMSNIKPMSVLVFGAGAIGTYVGGSLILAGQRVVLIERPAFTAGLCKKGLRLDISVDKSRNKPDPVIIPSASFTCVSSMEEALEHGPFDVAIFAMKSFDTAAALDGIKPYSDRMPPVLCLQNGVENETTIAAQLGIDRVITGTVTCSVARRAPGDIVLEKARGIGIAARHPISIWLAEVFNKAFLHARLYQRSEDMKWSKLLMNLPTSATAAILDMTPAEVVAQPALFNLEMHISHEAQAVMAAQDIHVVNLPGMPVQIMTLASHLPVFLAQPILMNAVGGGRGGKMPSFHIDLHAGRKQNEVEWLHGAVARFGGKLGVPTPVNRTLTETLMAMVRGEIPTTEFSHQPGKLIDLAAKAMN